jgi:hypothetical protein
VTKRLQCEDPEKIRSQLVELLVDFQRHLVKSDLRSKVCALIPAYKKLRDLGSSLIPSEKASAARDRILFYLLRYPLTVISGEELMVVAGIQEWVRRLRELRCQFGWNIVNGVTAKEMSQEGEFPLENGDVRNMGPDDYILLSTEQDKEAAYRWHVANEVRRKRLSVRDKLLEYLRKNVGRPISGEELRYVANEKTEWARRIRELRTEYGWPIVTRVSGNPDLPVGVYMLEDDRQSPIHDRIIPDAARRAVLRRDGYCCRSCGWSHKEWNRSDPRHLELHHVKPHAQGGENYSDNLITLCTVCHDEIHANDQER